MEYFTSLLKEKKTVWLQVAVSYFDVLSIFISVIVIISPQININHCI